MSFYNNTNSNNNTEFAQTTNPVSFCAFCGCTMDIYEKTGRLGCPHCYQYLKNQLMPFIKKIHKSTIHLGHIPEALLSRVPFKVKKLRLQGELTNAQNLDDQDEVERIRLALSKLHSEVNNG